MNPALSGAGALPAPRLTTDDPPAIRRLWRRLPAPMRRRVGDLTRWTGIPFLISFLLDYRRATEATRFAGHIPALLAAYESATGAERGRIRWRLDEIADAIVLPNGVRKTTYGGRQASLLREVLSDPECALPDRPLRVLDLPASTGAASLASHALLASTHAMDAYVLGDLAFHLLLDRTHDCVYDPHGTLLQVRDGARVRNVFLPHAAGAEYSWLTRLVLAPLAAQGRRLAARHPAPDGATLEAIPLLHPDVAEGVRNGRFAVLVANVFAPIAGQFDLIVCCNLLQQNYFDLPTIARGVDNLGRALAPDGLLIVGSPDAPLDGGHRGYRRMGDRLVLVRARGVL
jgi:SAM-dependent methyltransferase